MPLLAEQRRIVLRVQFSQDSRGLCIRCCFPVGRGPTGWQFVFYQRGLGEGRKGWRPREGKVLYLQETLVSSLLVLRSLGSAAQSWTELKVLYVTAEFYRNKNFHVHSQSETDRHVHSYWCNLPPCGIVFFPVPSYFNKLLEDLLNLQNPICRNVISHT